jgi:hypothetical protein
MLVQLTSNPPQLPLGRGCATARPWHESQARSHKGKEVPGQSSAQPEPRAGPDSQDTKRFTDNDLYRHPRTVERSHIAGKCD